MGGLTLLVILQTFFKHIAAHMQLLVAKLKQLKHSISMQATHDWA